MYKVIIEDNFDAMDPDARREYRQFATAEEAVSACQSIVDQSLREQYEQGMTAAELFHRYKLFGDDPFIVPPSGATTPVQFSGWDYARAQAQRLCCADK